MTEQEIKTMLEKLAEYRAAIDVVLLEKQALIAAILTDEIKAQLAEIDDEFSEKTHAASAAAGELEEQIKQAVTEFGQSVKGEFLHAVFSKGRVSWDTKSLDGYAAAHPELMTFRKEGQPSVGIRKV